MEAIFKSTDSALRYAYAFSTEQYGRSAMAVMYAPPGRGLGLGGLDGAGQAGMIRSEIDKLTPTQRAVLVMRYAPRDLPCSCRRPCCSGHYQNGEWAAALQMLVQHTAHLFAGQLANLRLRAELIHLAIARARPDYTALGKQFGVDRHTVAKHAAIIHLAVVGTRSARGEFDRAYDRIDELLHDAGIIGEAFAA